MYSYTYTESVQVLDEERSFNNGNLFINLYIYVYIHIYISVYVYIYIYTCIHIHIHRMCWMRSDDSTMATCSSTSFASLCWRSRVTCKCHLRRHSFSIISCCSRSISRSHVSSSRSGTPSVPTSTATAAAYGPAASFSLTCIVS